MDEPPESPPTGYRLSSLGGIDYGTSGRVLKRLIRGALWSVAAGFVCLVILAIFMPLGFIVGGRAVNETSARQSLQSIFMAQTMYRDQFPKKGFACSLQALGGDPSSGSPTSQSAQIIQADLASGIKSGYFFEIRSCRKEMRGGVERVVGYRAVALPVDHGKTGNRGFGVDESGILKFDPNGGDNCTQNLK